MTEPPSCSCHGEPMEWNKDKRPRFDGGGYWRCKVKHKTARRAYRRGEKGKAANHRYAVSDKGRANQHRYATSPGGVLTRQINSMFRVRY